MSDRNPLHRSLLGMLLIACLGLAACEDTGEAASAIPVPNEETVATPAESGQAIAKAADEKKTTYATGRPGST